MPALQVATKAFDPDAPLQPPEAGGGSASAIRTGSMIGRTIASNFRITSLIGSGAMGDVYQAQQLSLGKDVALKLLRRELMIDETLRRRFELEAKNASSLNHPNCIQIIDFGRDGELLFIAMEYLNGIDLSRRIERHWPFPLEQTVHIFDQVLAALEEAHEHGIVHRDLKPANIMLVSRRGDPDFVKVCDFGIAKSDGSQASWAEGLTMKGLVCGTPEYMSPEQARGEKLDGRSDLYAAGVVLYQMLTGEVPFKSSSPVALLSMHLGEPPEPPTVRKPGLDIPQSLEHLVLQALEKSRDKRPQTAAAFREALREAVSEVVAYVPGLSRHSSSGARASAARSSGSGGASAAVATDPVQEVRRKSRGWPFWLGAGAAVATVGIVLAPLWRSAPPASPPPVVEVQTPAPVAEPAPRPDETATATATAPAELAENADVVAPPALEAANEMRAAREPARPPRRKKERERGETTVVPAENSVAAPPSPSASDVPLAAAATETPAVTGAAAALQEAQRLLGKGQYAQACQKGEDARRLEPGLAAAHKFLGKCYMRAGDPGRANDSYRRYLELAPSAPDAAFIRSIVK